MGDRPVILTASTLKRGAMASSAEDEEVIADLTELQVAPPNHAHRPRTLAAVRSRRQRPVVPRSQG